jgi:UDP-N-acetylglucosamine transferase subunit ALG13
VTSARVLVIVGTDHHPFTRAVRWADSWAARHRDSVITIQHGHTEGPATAHGVDFVDQTELQRLIGEADVVVCHGGPGTITDARAAGHLPIVLPRDPDLGEHVDDHQQRFAAWAGRKGLINSCADITELDRTVAAAVAHPSGTRIGRGPADGDDVVAESVDRIETLVHAATSGRRASPDAPTVLYIGGFGRSGSTLLERLAGELDGVVCLGEVVHLWERGVGRNELCGCGTPFLQCPFWSAVGERAFGSWSHAQAEAVLGLRATVDRQRHVPITMWRRVPRSTRMQLARYASAYAAIYSAAAELTGARVVVDSSKHASLAFALSHSTQIDLRVIHMVRDSVAVAHSWAKTVRRPEASEGTASDDELMARFSPLRSGLHWTSNNAMMQALGTRGVPVTRMRYEDLVTSPQLALTHAWADLDLPGSPELPMTGHNTVKLNPIHSVAGNPMRFRTGELTIRPDDAWRREMPAARRRFVAALTSPLRAWYGYLGAKS